MGVSLFDSGTRVDDSSRNGNAAYWRAAEDTVWPQHTPKWQRSLKERLHTFKERLMASAGYLAVPGTASAGERSRYLKAAAGMAGLSLALLGIGLGALIAPYATSEPAILAADATPKLLVEDLRPQEEGSNQVAASSGDASSVAPLTLKLDAPVQTAQAQPEAASGTETSETQTASTQITDELLGADMAPGMAEPATPVTPERITRTVAVGRGDTLMGVLVGKGAVREDAHMAIAAMRSHYDPRKLRAGQELELTFEEWPREADATANSDEEAPSNTLLSMAIKTDVDRQVAVHRMADGTYKGEEIVTELKTGFVQAKATIDSSLFLAANDAGIPPAITVELIRMYSYDIDFQREIRVGDSFEVFFARDYDENGVAVREGQVLYAAMTVGGKKRQLWRFDPGDGNWDYFDQNGQSMKKFLMKTPIDGARISSNFGRRKHPILGYTKLHSGTDFAAPTGTPIYAAGDGTVEMARRYGGYGNYVRIRHANGYKTAYAHMNGYARGIKEGRRVKQGQVIGYVGTTGRSTGPHLHYEVMVNGKKTNPLKIRVPTGRKLAKAELKKFAAAQQDINLKMAAAPELTKVAKADIAE